jgi:hypothetical protein
MVLSIFDIALLAFIPLTIALLVIIAKLRKRVADLASAQKQRSHSVELTAFLSDMQKYGFGCVRINPGDVFYRSPKG